MCIRDRNYRAEKVWSIRATGTIARKDSAATIWSGMHSRYSMRRWDIPARDSVFPKCGIPEVRQNLSLIHI